MILQVCREYGHPPSWWASLSREDQVLILADLRLRADEAEAQRKRRR